MKKRLGNLLLLAMVVTLVTSMFATPITANDYEKQKGDTWSASLVASSSNVTVGDTFYVIMYVNSGTDSVTSVTTRIVTWNTPTLGAVNVTHNPGGTQTGNSGVDWNCSFGSSWTASSIYQDGALNNDTGNLTYGPGASALGGVSGNNTYARINFTAVSPGLVHIMIPDPAPWNPAQAGIAISDGIDTEIDFWTNCSVTVHPAGPTGLTATAYNYTIINITGTGSGIGADSVLLCGKAGSYPANYGDSLLYNGTNTTYNHTGLNNCTTYYYRAWTYNATTNIYSIENQSATATTSCYTNFSFAGASPTNSSTYTNCTYTVPVNVTVNSAIGSTFTYWINCSNGQTATATGTAANTSVGRSMTGLSHNTSYSWNITVTDTAGDSTAAEYLFTTGIGGGTDPAGSNPGPANAATGVISFNPTFNLTVTDADSDPMEVSFYWTNGSIIGGDSYTATGDSASTTFTGNLGLGTTYYWYALVNDTAGCDSTRVPASGTYSFTTQTSGLSITKQWDVDANNMITAWVNCSNNGGVNFSNLVINESFHANLTYDYNISNPANDSGDINSWTIPFLNYTGADKFYNITLVFNLSGRILNGTSITNTAWGNVNGTNTSVTSSALTFCYYATKQLHGSTIEWNATTANYSINITNCGSFYLNWVQINETYYDNTSFNDSSITPALGNVTFNITQIAPGGTEVTWMLWNINATNFANGTTIWNNFTLTSNETADEIERVHTNILGAMTEAIRITYMTSLTEVTGIGDSVISILGVVLIIGAIMLIVMVVYRQGLYGGGAEGGGE